MIINNQINVNKANSSFQPQVIEHKECNWNLCPVYPMLPFSLECPFLITSSVLSYVYYLSADLGHTLQYDGFKSVNGIDEITVVIIT